MALRDPVFRLESSPHGDEKFWPSRRDFELLKKSFEEDDNPPDEWIAVDGHASGVTESKPC